MSKVKEIHADSWLELKELLTDDYSHRYGYVFRGQGSSAWSLNSSLTRLALKNAVRLSADKIEAIQIARYRMAIRGLRGANPQALNDEELLCLGQHFGLATPLLDWTRSPYIAAFFAFESSERSETGKRAVWMLNRFSLERQFGKSSIISFVEPLQDDNNRIVAQAGLFTRVPTGFSLEDALRQCGGLDCLTKFTVDEDERLSALNDLNLMNIGFSRIYPDLAGAAMDCNMWVEVMSENKKETESLVRLMKELELLPAKNGDSY